MEITEGYDGGNVKETTFFVVWRPLGRTGNVKLIRRGNTSAFQIEDDVAGNTYYARVFCCNGATTYITGAGVVAKIGKSDVLSASIIQNSKMKIWTNLVAGSQVTFTNAPFATAAPIKIGGDSMNGLISEVIIYKRFLDEKERDSITKYLINKWGIKI